MGFKVPTFQDRTASAAAAKQKALEKLRAKPQPTEEELAAKREAAAKKDAAAAEARAAKLAERERQKAEIAAAKAAAAAEAAAIAEAEALAKAPRTFALPTEAERKAARDARYAARKARNR